MKKRIGILSALAIFIYILNGFNITKIDISNKSFQSENNQELYGNVDFKTYVIDFGENKEYLSGVRYKMSTYNEVYSAYSNENVEKQEYYIEFNTSGSKNNNEIYNILSKEQKEIIDQVKTTGDFSNINNGNYIECYGSYNDMVGYYCSIKLPTILYLEETRVPSGYTKNKVMTPGLITLVYQVLTTMPLEAQNDFYNTSNTVELKGIHLNNTLGYYMDFGHVDRRELVGLDIDNAWDYWELYGMSSTSIYDTPFQNGNQYLYLQSLKKNINLEIENYVNNKTTYTTTKNTNIEYKVAIKNVGNLDAVDSIVTSKLPKGFQYIEGTASNGGEYEDGIIKWRIDKLNSGEDIVLTYHAYAPNEIDTSREYVGEANVSNFALQQDVIAKTTTTRLSLMNPKTKNSLLITTSLVFAITLSLIIMVVRKKRIEESREYDDYYNEL